MGWVTCVETASTEVNGSPGSGFCAGFVMAESPVTGQCHQPVLVSSRDTGLSVGQREGGSVQAGSVGLSPAPAPLLTLPPPPAARGRLRLRQAE